MLINEIIYYYKEIIYHYIIYMKGEIKMEDLYCIDNLRNPKDECIEVIQKLPLEHYPIPPCESKNIDQKIINISYSNNCGIVMRNHSFGINNIIPINSRNTFRQNYFLGYEWDSQLAEYKYWIYINIINTNRFDWGFNTTIVKLQEYLDEKSALETLKYLNKRGTHLFIELKTYKMALKYIMKEISVTDLLINIFALYGYKDDMRLQKLIKIKDNLINNTNRNINIEEYPEEIRMMIQSSLMILSYIKIFLINEYDSISIGKFLKYITEEMCKCILNDYLYKPRKL